MSNVNGSVLQVVKWQCVIVGLEQQGKMCVIPKCL